MYLVTVLTLTLSAVAVSFFVQNMSLVLLIFFSNFISLFDLSLMYATVNVALGLRWRSCVGLLGGASAAYRDEVCFVDPKNRATNAS